MRSRPTDSPVRRAYRVTHSDLRGLARSRSHAARSQSEALLEVCKDRAFWHGDRYSAPAGSPGARAALRVLSDRIARHDCLDLMLAGRDVVDLPTFLRLRHGARGLWTAPVRLPSLEARS